MREGNKIIIIESCCFYLPKACISLIQIESKAAFAIGKYKRLLRCTYQINRVLGRSVDQSWKKTHSTHCIAKTLFSLIVSSFPRNLKSE